MSIDSSRLMVQFSADADRRLLAQILKQMKSYEPLHVMTNTLLNENNWIQSATRLCNAQCPRPT